MRKITVNCTHTQLLQLYEAMTMYIPIPGDHGQLLNEHRLTFLLDYRLKLLQQRKKYRLSFTPLSALAYLQIMLHCPMPHDLAHTVNQVISVIDKSAKDTLVHRI